MQNWASYLEHLKSILQKFDEEGAPEKSELIRFFREGFRPLVKAQIKQRGREHDSWEVLVKKSIDTKAKASLQPPSILREMDQCCPHSNRPAHSTVAKSQASSTRDPRDNPVKKLPPPLAPKPFNSSPAGSSETSDKKTQREKKKHLGLDQQQDQGRKNTSSTPATGANGGTRKNMS